MANSGESRPGSEQRAQMGEGGLPAGLTEHALRQQVAALEAELARTRAMVRERHQLAREVEQLRRHAGEAAQLREQVAGAGRRQNEFLAMLAHELRNPLAPLSMSASLLDSVAGHSGEMAQVSRVIRRQVDHMAHLLNDLLDAARLSSGKITLKLEPLLLSDAIEQALETVGPRLRERRQQLEVRLAPEALVVDGDAVRLTQVFTNLLGNASKYTGDGGRIALNARREDGQAVVTVSDNGAGIDPAMLPQIFDLFTQGPRSLARSEGGLGVGLSVVRNLVGMHGGRVEAASQGTGQGSTFTVRLPLSQGRPAWQAPPTRAAGERPSRILVIEDNIDACETLRTLLEISGHEVETASDGITGLERARGGRFDVLVCDIGLPGIDGYGVIEGLRAVPGGQAPFAIALSGYGQLEDRERALAAGFDRYLVKPAAPESLLAMVAEARTAAGL
ncbi:ATP-binding protein [Massilia sp. AB1]|uniref:hybrid sensor histidine kinase/response regulator n=1 Tax=Massilia sp. AB1 TaxID=2823371 RepID=UPI001E48783B|nr:ATP-binding protein [Massilia sp. AB1]